MTVLVSFEIYCNGKADAQHEDIEVHTLLFAPFADGSLEWTTPVDGLRVDDKPLWPNPPQEWLNLATSDDARWRRSYPCALSNCDVSVTSRDEKFRPVIERLLSHGVFRLSLAGLAGTLGD